MRGARDKSSEQPSSAPQRARRPRDEVSPPDPLLELQQGVGNQALLRLLGGGRLQAKSNLSPPTDAGEQQADLIAVRIAGSASGAVVQRKCAACAEGAPCSECGDEEREGRVQRKSTGLMVQRAARDGAESGPIPNAGAQAESSPAPAQAAPSRIVEDEAKDVKPARQWRRTGRQGQGPDAVGFRGKPRCRLSSRR